MTTENDKKKKAHKQRHIELHHMLDELVADFITMTGKTPSYTTLMEFMRWTHEQTINPTEERETTNDN